MARVLPSAALAEVSSFVLRSTGPVGSWDACLGGTSGTDMDQENTQSYTLKPEKHI